MSSSSISIALRGVLVQTPQDALLHPDAWVIEAAKTTAWHAFSLGKGGVDFDEPFQGEPTLILIESPEYFAEENRIPSFVFAAKISTI